MRNSFAVPGRKNPLTLIDAAALCNIASYAVGHTGAVAL